MLRVVLRDFHRRLNDIDRTRATMETLFSSGNITLRDIEVVYEALFLRAVTGFEQFCNDLFFNILYRKARYKNARVMVRVKGHPEALREVLFQGQKYLDWLPYDRAESRAKLFFIDGHPFTEVTDGSRSMIKTITIIRHAIAHSSEHADTTFLQKVIGSQPLRPSEKTPAGYLRSQMSNSPVQNRFQVYVAELGILAASLC